MKNRLLTMALITGLAFTGCKSEAPKTYSELDDRPAIERISEIKSELSTPEGATTAETLMYVLEVDASMKSMMALMGEQMVGVAQSSNPDLDENELKLSMQYAEEVMDELLPELIKEMSVVYENNFTEAELQEIIEFYSSGAGKKFVKNQTLLMQEGMGVAEKFVPKIEQKLMEKLSENKD